MKSQSEFLKSRRESDILSTLRRDLDRLGILNFRMQTGGMWRGKRYVKFGVTGMADLIAFVRLTIDGCAVPVPVWIETKHPGGRQRIEQAIFQQMVERQGHFYILATSASEAVEKLTQLKTPARERRL